MNQDYIETKAIVEAAGGCWHEWVAGICRKCKAWHGSINVQANPSPTDLNELFRLAKKFGFTHIVFWDYKSTPFVRCRIERTGLPLKFSQEDADTPADALRAALYQAVKS